MKKLWANLLVVLLLAALAMTCAFAKADQEIILDPGSDVDVQIESVDGIILEKAELTLDLSSLPELGENDDIILGSTLEDLEPATDPASNATVSNDNSGGNLPPQKMAWRLIVAATSRRYGGLDVCCDLFFLLQLLLS